MDAIIEKITQEVMESFNNFQGEITDEMIQKKINIKIEEFVAKNEADLKEATKNKEEKSEYNTKFIKKIDEQIEKDLPINLEDLDKEMLNLESELQELEEEEADEAKEATKNLEDLNLGVEQPKLEAGENASVLLTELAKPTTFIQEFSALLQTYRANAIVDTFKKFAESFKLKTSPFEKMAIIIFLSVPILIAGVFSLAVLLVLFLLYVIYYIFKKIEAGLKKIEKKLKESFDVYWRNFKSALGSGNFFKILLSTLLFSVVFINGVMYLCIKGSIIAVRSLSDIDRIIANLSAKTANLVSGILKAPAALSLKDIALKNGLIDRKLAAAERKAARGKGKDARDKKIVALKAQLKKLQAQKGKVQVRQALKGKATEIIKNIPNIKKQVMNKVGKQLKEEKNTLKALNSMLETPKVTLDATKTKDNAADMSAKLAAMVADSVKMSPLANNTSVSTKTETKTKDNKEGSLNFDPFAVLKTANAPQVDAPQTKAPKSNTTDIKPNTQDNSFKTVTPNNEIGNKWMEQSQQHADAAFNQLGITDPQSQQQALNILENARESDPPKSYLEIAQLPKPEGLGIDVNADNMQEVAKQMAVIRDHQEDATDNMRALNEWKDQHPNATKDELYEQAKVIANEDARRENENFKEDFGFSLTGNKETGEVGAIDVWKKDQESKGVHLDNPMSSEQFNQCVSDITANISPDSKKMNAMEAMYEQDNAFKQETELKMNQQKSRDLEEQKNSYVKQEQDRKEQPQAQQQKSLGGGGRSM
ncbi:MAG: hypothetical protein Ta2D_09310 [Rickettsiales bacterium]|nr:MAG: hypothetical protein Ta2D_09310 [Rickettsiales bacterium]